MAYDTRELAVKIVSDVDDFIKGTKEVQAETDKTQSSIDKFANGAKKAALVIGAVGVGLTAYAKSATDYTVEFVKNSKELARNTGQSVEDASRLEVAVTRMGLSHDQAITTLGIFSKKIQAATQDTKEAAQAHAELQNKIDTVKLEIKNTSDEIAKNGDKTGALSQKVINLKTDLAGLEAKAKDSTNAFERLGIKITDAQGNTRSFNDILLDTADKFKGMKDGSEKTATAMELFGKSGKDMLPFLNKGSEGIKDLEKRADELGLTLNAKTIGAVSRYIQSQKDLKQSTDALKLQIGTLTAPVLTRFNEVVNQVTTALISSSNPFHSVIVNVLAFGGPIMTATAGLVAFTANLTQTIAAMGGLRAVMGTVSAFMLGPWGLALAAAGLAIGLVAEHMINQKTQADQLKNAQNNLKLATDELKVSQDSLAGAQLNEEGAALAVEQAQRNYTQAVQEYGPNSLEARQALNDLKEAQLRVKDAHNQTQDALQKLHDKEQEVAKDKELIKHLQETQSYIDNVGNSALRAGDQIQRINGSKVTVKTTKGVAGTDVVDFVSTFGGGVPGHAIGTSAWSGGPTWVGERGPEIIDLPAGSRVYPAAQSQKMASQPSAPNLHFNVNIGMYAGMPIEKRQIALDLYRELVRAARAQGVQMQMIEAIGVQ